MTRDDALFRRLVDEAAVSRQPPAVDLHMHTTWTDGADTAAVMHEAACRQGLSLILFSEHARRTSTEWFTEFAAEVRALPAVRCRALVGAEVKILDLDGNIDIAPEIAESCDLVIASVHRFPGESGDIRESRHAFSLQQAIDLEFRLAWAALDNPDTDILGHPFGMTIRRFGGTPPWELMERLIAKAAETGKAFEINARYHDDPAAILRACIVAGAPVSFGSNAHAADEIGALHRHPGFTPAA